MTPSWRRPGPGDPDFGTLKAAALASVSNACAWALTEGASADDLYDVVMAEVRGEPNPDQEELLE